MSFYNQIEQCSEMCFAYLAAYLPSSADLFSNLETSVDPDHLTSDIKPNQLVRIHTMISSYTVMKFPCRNVVISVPT